MAFYEIKSPAAVIDYLITLISNKLAEGKNVLWLVPGGSAIKVAAEVSKKLPKKNLASLIVTLTDERHGEVGHTDSNWPQLKESGFKLSGATLQPVLTGKNLDDTAKYYAQILDDDLRKVDYSIALAGMGADGHIFGIKPNSPSVKASSLVVGYKWNDYERLTPTVKLLKTLDEIVIYAVGKEKWPQFDMLKDTINPAEQPAQLLKKCKKVIIFSDYVGN